MRLILLLILPFLAIAGAANAGQSLQTLQLLYTGNLDGELEPCGCSLETDYGGLQRRATLIDQLRADNPQLLLISAGGLFSPHPGNDQIKHGFIISGMAQLDYDAIGVQWSDLVHGSDLLTDSGMPFAAGNWRDNTFSTEQNPARADKRLYFSQWLDPLTSPYLTTPALSPINEDVDALLQGFKSAKAAGQLTVLATTLTLDAAQQQFDLSNIDILIIEAAYEVFAEPKQLGNTLILQPGSRGQRLGLLTLDIDDNGSTVDWQHRVIELPDSVASAPQLDSWYADYNEALRQDYLQRVAQRKALKSEQSPYLGEQVCAGCHQSQHEVWSQSEHAKAFADLEEVGKAFDGHCVGCHSVGFLQPGGYLDQDLTPQLSSVQCENCHGGGREHVANAGAVSTPNHDWPKEQVCAQCHVREHSPTFDLNSYWPKIEHPLLPKPE